MKALGRIFSEEPPRSHLYFETVGISLPCYSCNSSFFGEVLKKEQCQSLLAPSEGMDLLLFFKSMQIKNR